MLEWNKPNHGIFAKRAKGSGSSVVQLENVKPDARGGEEAPEDSDVEVVDLLTSDED